jgi:hypothetical protein
MTDDETIMEARELSVGEFSRLTEEELREAIHNSDGLRVARLETGQLTVVDGTTSDTQWALRGSVQIRLM